MNNIRKTTPSFPALLCHRRARQAVPELPRGRDSSSGPAASATCALLRRFTDHDTGLVSVGKFLSALRSTGLRSTDPRLSELQGNLDTEDKAATLDQTAFLSAIASCLPLVSRALRNQLVIPDFRSLCCAVQTLHQRCQSNTAGSVASYIPQLSHASPQLWGASVCSTDGQRFSVGDVTTPFTMQSCSKPVTYGIALQMLGETEVHRYVGREPSGRNFNELILNHEKQPHNPMINAGAIVVCSLLHSLVHPEMTPEQKIDFVAGFFRRLAGGEHLGFDDAVFRSEREAGDRNYALGYYMREHKCYPDKQGSLMECLDLYFRCCSLEATCDSMAVMAATLANGGTCPLTEREVFRACVTRAMLTLMHSCGMYDYSGEFAFSVGLPAKSGVSGSLMLVVPGALGVCLHSPPLDALGNSCRGIQFCQELVQRFSLHCYDDVGVQRGAGKKDPRRDGGRLWAAAGGDVAALRRMWEAGGDMGAADYDGRTALHVAAAEGHLACVSFLLERCTVTSQPRDRWGHLPADEAKRFGHSEVEQFICDWGVTVCLPHTPPI